MTKSCHSATTKLIEGEAKRLFEAASSRGQNTSEFIREALNQATLRPSLYTQLNILSLNLDSLRSLFQQLLAEIADGERLTPDIIRRQLQAEETQRLRLIRLAMGENYDHDCQGSTADSQMIQYHPMADCGQMDPPSAG